MFGSVLSLSRLTTSILMMDLVLGEGVLKLSGRYPAGTARSAGDAALLEAPLVEPSRFFTDPQIGVGVRLSPGNLPKLSIS